jgi:hypothetical protein
MVESTSPLHLCRHLPLHGLEAAYDGQCSAEKDVIMARLPVGFLVALTMVVAARANQMPKYGVTVTAEKGVDFSTLRTYTWRRAQPSSIKAIDAQIVAAIDRELAALGMTTAASGKSQVIVSYSSLTRTDVDLKGKENSKGLLPEYTVGTLVVVLVDAVSEQRLLRMRIDLPIDTKPDELEAAINRAVSQMFAEYPTRRRR